MVALSPCNAIAQQEAVETPEEIEEIVVVGTRRPGRTAIETAVPVDIFNRQDLDSVSSDDMLDIIRTLVPSFQVQRFAIADGATFVRPPQLRGMSAVKILVLVNGKRRHRSALVQLSGDGVHGPDLATIPSIALKSVEVWTASDLKYKLRDYHHYYNKQRAHSERIGDTPVKNSSGKVVDINSYRWEKHCRGLFGLPIAA